MNTVALCRSPYTCFWTAMHVQSGIIVSFASHFREFQRNRTRHHRSLPPQLLHPKSQFQALREITPTTSSLLQPTRCNTRCDKIKWKPVCDNCFTNSTMEHIYSTQRRKAGMEGGKYVATDDIRDPLPEHRGRSSTAVNKSWRASVILWFGNFENGTLCKTKKRHFFRSWA